MPCGAFLLGVGRRIEIAHFWQDVCLSIAAYPAREDRPLRCGEQWLDTGPTRIRVRDVEAATPIPRDWALLSWVPFAFLLLIVVGAALAGSTGHRDNAGTWVQVASVLDAVVEVEAVPCSRGDVLVVTNAMPGTLLHVSCWDPTVNTREALRPGESLRAAPDALASCMFSDRSHSWWYPRQIPAKVLKRRRVRPSCDACAPYLFDLEIDGGRTLLMGPRRFGLLSFAPAFAD